jgi:general L-amino acid transport system permease protein
MIVLRHRLASLVSSPLNIVLTVAALTLLAAILVPLVQWGLLQATFSGSGPDACGAEGACWIFIRQRLGFFVYGFYPGPENWRVNTVFALLALQIVPQFFAAFPWKRQFGWAAVTIFPVIGFILLRGGWFGLEYVPTDAWGGLMLNLTIAYVGIAVALPCGTLLALGRRSKMPIVHALSVAFIELWRGVPLISVLFMASVMLPMFMSEGTFVDKLLRALIGIIMFESAYMAEVVRGGLQAIPKGQYEAAAALGLGYWRSMILIVLPQALKLVIPGIVNTFIALFKDTTLVLIIGLLDVLATVQSAIKDPSWHNVASEGYLFAAVVFWAFCFSMSRYSQRLERKLDTGYRR